MHSIWSGAIVFGLLHIPVHISPASEDRELAFHLLRREDGCRIRYTRICEETGEEVPYEDVVRGYEYEDGKWVVLEEEDFRRANVRKTQAIEITGFLEPGQVDLKYLEKPYYLEPEAGAEQGYALLCQAIKQSGKAGVARFVLNTREHMGLLLAEGNALALIQMRFTSEIQPPEGLALPRQAPASPMEMELAMKLIDAMSVSWNPTLYQDSYTQDLKRLIREKIEGSARQVRDERPAPLEAGDLVAQLSQSVQKAQEEQRIKR